MFCSKCGKEMADDLNFCPHCGNQVRSTSEASNATPNAQPSQIFVPAASNQLKKCPACGQMYQKPKKSTLNYVLIVIGIIGCFIFPPIGIALLLVGLLKGNNAPCPHCGISPKDAKTKVAYAKLTPDKNNGFYKALADLNTRIGLRKLLVAGAIIFSIVLFLPFIMNVKVEYSIGGLVEASKELSFIDAIFNSDETVGAITFIVWLLFPVAALLNANSTLRSKKVPHIAVGVAGLANIVLAFIVTEKFIVENLMYRLVKYDYVRELIDHGSAPIGGIKTLMILCTILAVVAVILTGETDKAVYLNKEPEKKETNK